MQFVSSLALHTEGIYNEEHNNYVSLSRLLNLSSENIRHNIILKNPDTEDDDTAQNKTILFIPRVECETEIPDEEIFPIPQSLSKTSFFTLFSGILFDSKGALVLLLNAEQLIQIPQTGKTP
jgi:chemotaxis signal transduction protein